MGYPPREKQCGGGQSRPAKSDRAVRDKIAHMIQSHDDHDQSAQRIDGIKTDPGNFGRHSRFNIHWATVSRISTCRPSATLLIPSSGIWPCQGKPKYCAIKTTR